jgi:hypothetical protein
VAQTFHVIKIQHKCRCEPHFDITLLASGAGGELPGAGTLWLALLLLPAPDLPSTRTTADDGVGEGAGSADAILPSATVAAAFTLLAMSTAAPATCAPGGDPASHGRESPRLNCCA